MIFQPGYIYSLNEHSIKKHFPNLTFESFKYTSEKTDDYNCAAWSIEIEDEWIQFRDPKGMLDVSITTYINYFTNLGFSITNDKNFEEGVKKIAIYKNEQDEFKHVARLMSNGKWTSKIGDWEDIEHDTLEVLADRSYGKPCLIMEKRKD